MPLISPELEFIFASCRNALRLAKNLPSHDISLYLANTDEAKLATSLKRHRLPYLLQAGSNGVVFSETIATLIANQQRRSALQNLRLSQMLIATNQVLSDAQVRFVNLKGPLLAEKLHRQISSRQMRDLDILVHPEDLVSAIQCLETDGFRFDEEPYFLGSDVTSIYLNSAKKHISCVKEQITVELHWRLSYAWGELGGVSNYKTIESVVMQQFGGRKLPVLPDDDLLIHLCVHGAEHAWARVKWLMDIACLIEITEFDWERWVNKVKRLKLERAVAQTMALLVTHVHVELPKPLEQFIQAVQLPPIVLDEVYREWNSTSLRQNMRASRFRRLPYLLALAPNLSSKVAYSRTIWNNPDFFPWERLPRALWPLNYFVSPFMGLFSNASERAGLDRKR